MSAPDRVDRMHAWLEAHRDELGATAAGQLRFAWHAGDLRVELTRSDRLTTSGTMTPDGHPAHPAAAS